MHPEQSAFDGYRDHFSATLVEEVKVAIARMSERELEVLVMHTLMSALSRRRALCDPRMTPFKHAAQASHTHAQTSLALCHEALNRVD